ncbi:MAG TPA: ThiF family adenylyltransferase [Acidimicrobiales bacterium]|nr:ThiF family adenylyltransferase [Acidimicrobiales bacterium]
MIGVTLALPEGMWEELVARLALPIETAAVIAARTLAGPGHELTLLGRSVHWAPDEAYTVREADQLVLESWGWAPALGHAAADGAMAVFVHTHPGEPAQPSGRDRVVDTLLAEPFRVRTGQRRYAHLVLGGTTTSPQIAGGVLDTDDSWRPLRAVRAVGRRLRVLLSVAEPANAEAGDDPFDRQVRAFGRPGQRVLKALHVGIVGVGGTGSPLFEQLVRLGVGELTVIDPDTLTAGNVTRVYGSGMADVDRAKVAIAEAHAQRIGLGTTVRTLQRSVTALEAAWALRHCDVVFGCTDDNVGRMVLSRLGYWCLMPVIDTGVLIDTASDSGVVSGVFGRVTIVGPGAACLACRSRIDLARAQAEALDPVERRKRAAEGYAVGLADPDPSVVAYTTMVAATAVGELLERLFGYGSTVTPSELMLRHHARSISLNTAVSRSDCYCADPSILGSGDSAPFLDRTWI